MIFINKVLLSPASIAFALGAVAFFLVVAGSAEQFAPAFTGRSELVALFNLDGERNIPAFFSMLLILFAALLLAIIAFFKKRQGAVYTLYWSVLAFGFLFMAADEAMSIHERLNEPMSRLLGEDRPGIFYLAWVIPGMATVLFVGLFFLKFLRHLPGKTRFLFLLAAALYLGGAIALELVGNHYAALNGTASRAYAVCVTVEEWLEMAGIIVFIFALLRYMAEIYGEMVFGFDSGNILHEQDLPKTFDTPVVSLKSSSARVHDRNR